MAVTAWPGASGVTNGIAGGDANGTAASTAASTQVGTAAPLIDWGRAPLAAAAESRGARSAVDRVREAAPWQARFVNHLGATAEQLNPNAKLRVQVDVTPRVAAELASAE